MAKWVGWVEFGSGQIDCGSNRLRDKKGHFIRVKNEFGLIGL